MCIHSPAHFTPTHALEQTHALPQGSDLAIIFNLQAFRIH